MGKLLLPGFQLELAVICVKGLLAEACFSMQCQRHGVYRNVCEGGFCAIQRKSS